MVTLLKLLNNFKFTIMDIFLKRLFLFLGVFFCAFNALYSQDSKLKDSLFQYKRYEYAYVSVQAKGVSSKFKVEVDLGDTPEQIKIGKEYSENLTNKKSYASVLNFMASKHFELVTTRDDNLAYQGTGLTFGIIFIMRKKVD